MSILIQKMHPWTEYMKFFCVQCMRQHIWSFSNGFHFTTLEEITKSYKHLYERKEKMSYSDAISNIHIWWGASSRPSMIIISYFCDDKKMRIEGRIEISLSQICMTWSNTPTKGNVSNICGHTFRFYGKFGYFHFIRDWVFYSCGLI